MKGRQRTAYRGHSLVSEEAYRNSRCDRNYENAHTAQFGIQQQYVAYVCFADFEKAFDRVNWPKMMTMLKTIGVDWRNRRLIAELYSRQEMIVRLDHGWKRV